MAGDHFRFTSVPYIDASLGAIIMQKWRYYDIDIDDGRWTMDDGNMTLALKYEGQGATMKVLVRELAVKTFGRFGRPLRTEVYPVMQI